MERTKEFYQLCKIVNHKNELQKTRHSTRAKFKKLEAACTFAVEQTKWKKQVRDSSATSNPHMKKIKKLAAILEGDRSRELYPVWKSIEHARENIVENMPKHPGELRVPSRLPKWMQSCRSSALRIQCKEAHIEKIKAEVEIHTFTMRISSAQRDLMKSTGYHMNYNTNNMISLCKSDEYLSIKDIANIAATQDLEDAIATKEKAYE